MTVGKGNTGKWGFFCDFLIFFLLGNVRVLDKCSIVKTEQTVCVL